MITHSNVHEGESFLYGLEKSIIKYGMKYGKDSTRHVFNSPYIIIKNPNFIQKRQVCDPHSFEVVSALCNEYLFMIKHKNGEWKIEKHYFPSDNALHLVHSVDLNIGLYFDIEKYNIKNITLALEIFEDALSAYEKLDDVDETYTNVLEYILSYLRFFEQEKPDDNVLEWIESNLLDSFESNDDAIEKAIQHNAKVLCDKIDSDILQSVVGVSKEEAYERAMKGI